MTTSTIFPQDSNGNFIEGTPIPLDSLPQAFTYSGDFIATCTIQYYGNTYVQTFENNGTNITNISGWVLQ